ncbi:MAG TPA: anaerobic sulfatase maturase [Flavisolibacter sp.]
MKSESPSYFQVLAKPTGATCNLDCQYCYFLSKELLYPGSSFRMTDELLQAYIKQTIESQNGPDVAVAWQGGEPTLMGLAFFRRSIELEKKYQRPGTTITNTIQTNGTLINEDWCSFFKANHFLVGLSIDGPKELHDFYRVDKGGHGTFDRVVRAAKLMQRFDVDFNILTTVNAHNANYPLEVYKFLRDELKVKFIQFIPIVEHETQIGLQESDEVTSRSITAEQWGHFLITVFDEWVRHDVGEVFVQMFDSALASWYGVNPGLCIFAEKCGNALALEHNGDLYSCDHFVDPDYLLGNILNDPLAELVTSQKQQKFGDDKYDTLPDYCLRCEVRFACNGECPKNRFIKTPAGQAGLNYLCAGYRAFFNHIDQPMRFMALKLRLNQAPSDIVKFYNSTNENLSVGT